MGPCLACFFSTRDTHLRRFEEVPRALFGQVVSGFPLVTVAVLAHVV